MERLALTLLVLAVFLLGVWGMWLGWRRKAREQSARYAPFPQVPEADDLGQELAATDGVYVATTPHGRWQDRIVTRGVGMRAPATVRRYDSGVVVERHGAPSFFIPASAITEVTTARKMAGKVIGTDGLLVITWQHGDRLIDSGFRSDHAAEHTEWVDALTNMINKTEGAR